jgi:hypothetical protein
MNYKHIFGFYNSADRTATIYDGRKSASWSCRDGSHPDGVRDLGAPIVSLDNVSEEEFNAALDTEIKKAPLNSKNKISDNIMEKNWTLLRYSSTDQRLWQGEDGTLYLADHSGDGNIEGWNSTLDCRHDVDTVGTPDDTDDGPLRVLVPQSKMGDVLEINYNPEATGHGLKCRVRVIVERREDKVVSINVEPSLALNLGRRLGVPVLLRIPSDVNKDEMENKVVSSDRSLSLPVEGGTICNLNEPVASRPIRRKKDQKVVD